MSKRKDLTAEPNVKIDDILAAREGRKKKKMKRCRFEFDVFVKICVIWKKRVERKKLHRHVRNYTKF